MLCAAYVAISLLWTEKSVFEGSTYSCCKSVAILGPSQVYCQIHFLATHFLIAALRIQINVQFDTPVNLKIRLLLSYFASWSCISLMEQL